MKKRMSKKKSIPSLVLIGVLVTGLGVGNYFAMKYKPIITTYMGHKSYEVKENGNGTEDTEYFKTSFSSEEERLLADAAAGRMTAADGFVLLKNEGNALPMDGNKVTLFGVNSAEILYGGGGSGAVDTETVPTLKAALEETGFEVNPAMWDFYTTGAAADIRMDVADIAGTGRYVIHEAAPEMFTKTETEEKLLSYVGEKFDKVIVLVNSGNAMELSFLEQEEYGIDACLWIGNPGQDGLYAVGDILNGTVNPSGRTVDTYAYNPLGAPAVANFGNLQMENADGAIHTAYAVYQEGIYVGYKYYETRYEDTVLNQGNASANVGVTADGADTWNYADEVQFPFGYGLSYTTFEQELVGSDYKDGQFTFDVKVTNTGDKAGKEVVQLYLQSPYTEYDKTNGVEKASVALCGFAKTETLEAGASETVKITVSEEELKAYDASANNGEGTYILEKGTYYFTAAKDAHQAVNNILAAKGAKNTDSKGDAAMVKDFEVAESNDYAVSSKTGNPIKNQFADADMKTYDDSFVYLTRNDWENTFPETYKLTATPEMVEALAIPEGTDNSDAQMPVTGADNGLSLAMMRGLDADDPAWDDLLNQMTPEEMYNLVRVGGYQTQAVNSVSAPSTICVDGPAFVGNAGTTGVTRPEKTYAWCSEVVISSTWNEEMAANMGRLIGEDCLAQGDLNFAGWYAPAMNIHRTAFSGRNFEYYSEDGYLSGQFGKATVNGAREKGVITFVKHFALNDQETNRSGMSTFANEQSIRDIYLKA